MRDARIRQDEKGITRGVAWWGVSELEQAGAGTHMRLAQEGRKEYLYKKCRNKLLTGNMI